MVMIILKLAKKWIKYQNKYKRFNLKMKEIVFKRFKVF